MTDTTNSLTTNQSSGITLQSQATGSTTQARNDAQYPYSEDNVVTTDDDVAATASAPTTRPPQLPRELAVLMGPVYSDEANMTLALSTKIANAAKKTATENLKTRKDRLEAQAARQKEAREKYLHDFVKAMRNARAQGALRLFIKIAAPLAAAAATIATFGAAAPVATALCAYAFAATTSDAAGGPDLGMASNSQKALAAAFAEIPGVSDEEAEELGGLAAGLIAIAASGYASRTELLMADPSFGGMFLGNLARVLGVDEESAGYVEMAGTLAVGIGATGHSIAKSGGGDDAADQANNAAQVAGAGGRGAGQAGAAAGAADDAALAGAQAADDVGGAGLAAADDAGEAAAQGANAGAQGAKASKDVLDRLEEMLPYIVLYGNYTAGGLAIANPAVGTAEAALEMENERSRRDMTLAQNEEERAKLAIDDDNEAIGRFNRDLQHVISQYIRAQQRALDMYENQHATNMKILNPPSV